jgi:hypothetical protein
MRREGDDQQGAQGEASHIQASADSSHTHSHGWGLLTSRVEVDEDKAIVKKYYKTTNFNICISGDTLRRLLKAL